MHDTMDTLVESRIHNLDFIVNVTCNIIVSAVAATDAVLIVNFLKQFRFFRFMDEFHLPNANIGLNKVLKWLYV